MCSINHELKAIYFHIPKNGGLYIQTILEKYYGFKTIYFTSEKHNDFIPISHNNVINVDNLINGFIKIRRNGIYKYYETSEKHNKLSDMDEDKWKNYYKFTFTRNPYTKLLSAFNYLILDDNTTIEKFIDDKDTYNNYIFTHSFITQYEHMLNKENNINFDFIGKFENLNEDLVNVLFKIGITKIKHGDIILNNFKINENISTNKKTINHLTDTIISKINNLFNIDFKTFNYPIISSKNELMQNITFEELNKKLYEKLKSENLLENTCSKLILDNGLEIKINDNIKIDNILFDKNLIIQKKRDGFIKKLLQQLTMKPTIHHK